MFRNSSRRGTCSLVCTMPRNVVVMRLIYARFICICFFGTVRVVPRFFGGTIQAAARVSTLSRNHSPEYIPLIVCIWIDFFGVSATSTAAVAKNKQNFAVKISTPSHIYICMPGAAAVLRVHVRRRRVLGISATREIDFLLADCTRARSRTASAARRHIQFDWANICAEHTRTHTHTPQTSPSVPQRPRHGRTFARTHSLTHTLARTAPYSAAYSPVCARTICNIGDAGDGDVAFTSTASSH